MASQAEDALSAAGNFFSGLWGQATDYLTAREERKAAEAMTSRNAMSGVTGTASSWTDPDAVAAAMGTGSAGKYQNLMLFLAFAGVAISLLAFIRK